MFKVFGAPEGHRVRLHRTGNGFAVAFEDDECRDEFTVNGIPLGLAGFGSAYAATVAADKLDPEGSAWFSNLSFKIGDFTVYTTEGIVYPDSGCLANETTCMEDGEVIADASQDASDGFVVWIGELVDECTARFLNEDSQNFGLRPQGFDDLGGKHDLAPGSVWRMISASGYESADGVEATERCIAWGQGFTRPVLTALAEAWDLRGWR